MSINRILVPVDGSMSSVKAAEYAAFLAEKSGATLDFFYVASDINKDIPSQIVFDGVREKLPAGVKSETHTSEGKVHEAITNAAIALKDDMIIMGSRGLGIFRGSLIGSVSQKVVEHAPVPVMVVK